MTEIRRFNSYGDCGPKTYSKSGFTREVRGQTADEIHNRALAADRDAEIARRREIASRGLGQLQ
jgi:hypothetical protein